jgi:hypothetical protein
MKNHKYTVNKKNNQNKPTAATVSLPANFPGGSFANPIITNSEKGTQPAKALASAYRYILGDQWGVKHDTV